MGPGFLNLLMSRAGSFFVVGKCPDSRVCHSIPSLFSLDAHIPPPPHCNHQTCLQTKLSLTENPWARATGPGVAVDFFWWPTANSLFQSSLLVWQITPLPPLSQIRASYNPLCEHDKAIQNEYYWTQTDFFPLFEFCNQKSSGVTI